MAWVYVFAGAYDHAVLNPANSKLLKGIGFDILELDGITPATIYDDRIRSNTVGNPVTTDPEGNLHFFTEPGFYLLKRVGAAASTAEQILVRRDPEEPVFPELTEAELTALTSAPVGSAAFKSDNERGPFIKRLLTGVVRWFHLTFGAVDVQRDFGAVGDGVTLDTTAIQNAINTGKTVYFPKTATGYLCGPLTMSTAGQRLIGMHRGATGSVLTFNNNSTGSLLTIGASFVRLEHLLLKCAAADFNSTATGLLLTACTRSKFVGVTFEQFGYGVHSQEAGNNHQNNFDSCYFFNNKRAAVYAPGGAFHQTTFTNGTDFSSSPFGVFIGKFREGPWDIDYDFTGAVAEGAAVSNCAFQSITAVSNGFTNVGGVGVFSPTGGKPPVVRDCYFESVTIAQQLGSKFMNDGVTPHTAGAEPVCFEGNYLSGSTSAVKVGRTQFGSVSNNHAVTGSLTNLLDTSDTGDLFLLTTDGNRGFATMATNAITQQQGGARIISSNAPWAIRNAANTAAVFSADEIFVTMWSDARLLEDFQQSSGKSFGALGATPAAQQAATVDLGTVLSTFGFRAAGGNPPLSLGETTPAQITSNQANYNPGATAGLLRLSSDATRFIQGLVGGTAGKIVVFENVGSFNIVLQSEHGSATAANRFLVPGAAATGQLPLFPGDIAVLIYDGTDSRWRVSKAPSTHTANTWVAKQTFSAEIEIDGDLNHDGTNVGFYGVAPTARQVLATGAGATADDIITALQTLGLVSQT